MSKRRLIDALAKRFAARRGFSGMHAGMQRFVCAQAIREYANNYLTQHGKLPEGVHTCRKRLVGAIRSAYTVEVDFTRLAANDRSYPEPVRPPVTDPVVMAEIERRGIEFCAEWARLHPSSSGT